MKKFLSILLSFAVIIVALCPITPITIGNAAEIALKFDLGGGITAEGFIGVSAAEGYSSAKGYGFADTSKVSNVSANNGSGALGDAVQFTDLKQGGKAQNTFNVDLENGLYNITVTLGNTERTSIAAENNLQIINMTGNACKDSFLLPITDGQLNIAAVQGKENYAFTISALEITKISDNAEMPPTVWICGDSTVCNYYGGTRGGWGQFFTLDGYNVRNMASAGQFAKGFMDSGQYEPIYTYAKPGDIYIISIGINDTNYSNNEEYKECLRKMTTEIKSKGATVILVAQQGRNGDVANRILNAESGRWWNGDVKNIAAECDVQCVDLFKLFYNYCEQVGADTVNKLYDGSDTLHFSTDGAAVLAELVENEIKQPSVDNPKIDTENPVTIDTSKFYMIKNVNSGLYMSVDDSNVVQSALTAADGADRMEKIFRFEASNFGYYYIFSMTENGDTGGLIPAGKNNGDNVSIGTIDKSHTGHWFKIIDNGLGSYLIISRESRDVQAVEVAAMGENSGDNVQMYDINGYSCQYWLLETVDIETTISTTTSETISETTTSETISTTNSEIISTTTSETIVTNLGDVNLNEQCGELSDVILLGKYLGNKADLTEQQKINANCHNDRGLTSNDLIVLVKLSFDEVDIVDLPL